MTRDELDHKYVEREVDNKLWQTSRQWVRANHQVKWLSLDSAPGRGNTSLLERLQRLASRDINFEAGIKTIMVKGNDVENDGPPQRLFPLTKTLHDINSAGRTPRLRQAWRRIRNAGVKGAFISILAVLGCIMLGCLINGLEQYTTASETQSFFEFLTKNWHRFPLWFAVSSVGSVPVSLIALYLTRNRLYPLLAPESPGDRECGELKTTQGLTEALLDICDPWRGVMLLIDDAHRLAQIEIDFLTNLFRPSEKMKGLHGFNREKSVLIITVDYEGNDWRPLLPEESRANYETLTVPELELVELREILNAHLDMGNEALPDKEKQQLIDTAQHNVKALFKRHQDALLDEVSKEFLDKQKHDIGSRFGLDELMAYQAARHENFIKKSQLLDWLDSLSSNGYLSMFRLKPPQTSQQMVVDFGGSSLVRASGEIYHFDVQRCRALREWLKDRSPFLVAQAHYHWSWNSLNTLSGKQLEPGNVSQLTEAERHEIKVGAWHASQIGLVQKLESAADVLEQASGLSEDERSQRRYDVAEALLIAAAIWRSEGNLGESDDSIQDALDWLRGPEDKRQQELLECAVNQHWSNYWLSGDATTREQLRNLGDELPVLRSKPSWIVHQRFEELLQGCEALSPAPAEADIAEAGLRDLHSLTETLLDVRRTHGFIAPALRDPDVIIRKPVAAPENTLAESRLRQIQAAAASERDGWAELTHTLEEWRDRLREMELSSGGIGDDALLAYSVARYWHLLSDVWHSGYAALNSSPPEKRNDEEEQLIEVLEAACLTSLPNDMSISESLWREARQEYDRALRIAVVLGWEAFAIELRFHLGTLLQRYTPEERRTEAPPWWKQWSDRLFSECIKFESEQGWVVFSPAIHRIRWKFFEDKNREISVEDAYNAFLAIKRAHYPNEIVLNTHREVSTILSNYGDTDEDRRRSAELHTMWARELAALPEAVELRRFESLQREQAEALLFAAQARRLLEDLEVADSLLNEAFTLLEQAAPLTDEDDQEAERLHVLRISLSLQRAWVREAQGQKEEYSALLRDLWRDLRTDDEATSNVLASLLAIEARENLLGDPWPMNGAILCDDPDNGALSIPEAWFEGHGALSIKNRFEFRFHQLLHLATSDEVPSARLLKLVAIYFHWRGMNRYGESALRFAEFGLQYKLTQETRGLVIDLLEAVRHYFAAVEKVDRHELEALRMLMNYNPDSIEHRMDYVRVLLEYKYLLEHELLVRKEEEQQNWYAMADRVDDYLGLLVDSDLLAHQVTLKLRRSGVSLETLQETQKHRTEVLQKARADYAGGDHGACLEKLSSAIPLEQTPWVFKRDLQVLNLWMLCAKRIGAVDPDEHNRRAMQLRDFALEYIRQFSKVIKEVQVQHLALGLLDGLEKSAKGLSQHLPPPKTKV